jgi:hypothetical protein
MSVSVAPAARPPLENGREVLLFLLFFLLMSAPHSFSTFCCLALHATGLPVQEGFVRHELEEAMDPIDLQTDAVPILHHQTRERHASNDLPHHPIA